MANVPSKPNTCSVQVLLGIAWLKSTKQQKKVTKNIMSNTLNRLKELFSEVEKDLTSRNGTLLNASIDPYYSIYDSNMKYSSSKTRIKPMPGKKVYMIYFIVTMSNELLPPSGN